MCVLFILVEFQELSPFGTQACLKQESEMNLAVPAFCFHIVRTSLCFVHAKMYSMVCKPVRKDGQSETA